MFLIITVHIAGCIELCYLPRASTLYFIFDPPPLPGRHILSSLPLSLFISLFCFSCTSFIVLHQPPLLSSFSMSYSSFLCFLHPLFFLSFSFFVPLVLECFLLLLLLLFMRLSIMIVNYEICWQAGDPFGKYKFPSASGEHLLVAT